MRWKLTRHHRKPRFFKGNGDNGNIKKIPRCLHEAWHLIFGPGYPHTSVAALLNAQYLALDRVMIPVQTQHLDAVLKFLANKCGDHLSAELLGVTKEHEYYRKPSERRKTREY